MSNQCEATSPGERIDFSSLSDRVQTIERRARRLGVRVRALVASGDQHLAKDADHPMFAASLGKLPLAAMAIDRLDADELLDVEAFTITHPQTGERLQKQPVTDALTCMLQHSSNLSYRVLADRLGGATVIQEYLTDHGWNATTVAHSGSAGRTLIGETSPIDALAQLRRLIEPDDTALSVAAAQALRDNAVDRYGIRRVVTPKNEVKLWNKTGEYNGDPEDPWAYRHDVGRVTGPAGTVEYAIMTSTTPRRKLFADMTVGRMTAEVAASAGAQSVGAMGRHVLSLLR